MSKWTYLSRVQPHIHHLLFPINNALRTKLLPSLTSRPPPNDSECALFNLPARLGGLGVRLLSRHAEREHKSSQLIIAPLTDHILNQEEEYGYDILNEQMQRKAQVSSDNRRRWQEEADTIHQQLLEKLQKAVELAKQKGASSWLTTLPLTEHGFTLHKAAFHDALALTAN